VPNGRPLLFLILTALSAGPAREVYLITKGSIRFLSTLPSRPSKDRPGAQRRDRSRKENFRIFGVKQVHHGFNNPLQQEHFYDNYIEADKYPNSTFDGKIIEEIDFTKNGESIVRAKGDAQHPRVSRERIH